MMMSRTDSRAYVDSPGKEVLERGSLARRYQAVRRQSETLCASLETEDFVIQTMPDVSPTRWHLAHVTWFFETLVLSKAMTEYRPFHPDFVYLFNSYYNTIGKQFPRDRRGFLSRPTVKEVFDYRRYVDGHMYKLLGELDPPAGGGSSELANVVEVGLNHEQQHQELILTDIKHVFSYNPLHPVYRARRIGDGQTERPMGWIGYDEGLRRIGHGDDGFSYDNERSRHRVFLDAFELGDRLVTNREFIEFIDDRGYERPEHWLSEGWATALENKWQAPMYWVRRDDGWWSFTLSGMRRVEPDEPVCHVSFFEADGYARWAGVRLPTEPEWEVASETVELEGNFMESERFHPTPMDADPSDGLPAQMFGDVWEWTSSPYVAYPGYRPPEGAMGEYNGKFMCNQMVLRGGCCATSRTHIRRTYRNFFAPSARWQFAGIRLAR